MYVWPIPASADAGEVTVYLRIEGPADRDTFRATGEYTTIWSGEVQVPREVTISVRGGRQYRLYTEADTYKATRLSDGQTWTLGTADDARGATSVLAALHQASSDGGFDYEVIDKDFPGMGFYVTSIGGVADLGSTGWSYRVWNNTDAASPQVSIERFLLGYDSTGVDLPHTEVLLYWGSATRCYPLRVTPVDDVVRCGLPTQVLVEAYIDHSKQPPKEHSRIIIDPGWIHNDFPNVASKFNGVLFILSNRII